jgi:hypothetical protein
VVVEPEDHQGYCKGTRGSYGLPRCTVCCASCGCCWTLEFHWNVLHWGICGWSTKGGMGVENWDIGNVIAAHRVEGTGPARIRLQELHLLVSSSDHHRTLVHPCRFG